MFPSENHQFCDITGFGQRQFKSLQGILRDALLGTDCPSYLLIGHYNPLVGVTTRFSQYSSYVC